LEELYAAAEKDPENFSPVRNGNGAKTKSILLENKEKIMHFKRLATMANDAPVGDVFNDCSFDNFSGSRASEALLELGFASLAKRLPQGKISRNGTLF